MIATPDKLEFRQHWILFLVRIWAPVFILYSFGTFSRWPNWKDILWIMALGWIFVWPMRHGRTRIVIDKNGIAWGGSRSFVPWSRILACACKNDNKARTLRIFQRWPDAAVSAISQAEAKYYFDISFDEVGKPNASLAKAFDACVAWIAATRDPSETIDPIREFIEPSPPPRPERNFGYWAAATRDFAIGLVAPFLILSLFYFLTP